MAVTRLNRPGQICYIEGNDADAWYTDSLQIVCDGVNSQNDPVYELVNYVTNAVTLTTLPDPGAPFYETFGAVAPNGSLIATQLVASPNSDPTKIHDFNVNTGPTR